MRKRLFLGLTTAALREAEHLLEPVVATRSTRPESKEKEIERKTAERAKSLHLIPGVASVTGVCLLDAQGQTVFEGALRGSAPAGVDEYHLSDLAVAAVTRLRMSLTDANLSQPRPDTDEDEVGASLYGLDARSKLRLMALDALAHASRSRSVPIIPPGLWVATHYESRGVCDPYETAIPATYRADFSCAGLCRLLSVEMPPADTLATCPRRQAQLALDLANALHLFRD